MSPTLSKVRQAEAWLREYLKHGPRGIPNSFWNRGAPRYEGSELPPFGIGKKTIDKANANPGVLDTRSGPRGERRWSLPDVDKSKPEEIMSTTPTTTNNSFPEWHRYLNPENHHAAASLYPMLEKNELQAMADNIKAIGLLNPVVLLDGKVLDGRNRLLACKLADVEPRFVEWQHTTASPIEWVLSQNSYRRQLEPGQRAVIALEAEELLAAEAKLRSGTRTDLVENIPPGSFGKARDKAAKLVGVNPRYVQDAKKIKWKAPELMPEIASGQITIPAALKKVKEKEQSAKQGSDAPYKLGDQVKLKAHPEVRAMEVKAVRKGANKTLGEYWLVDLGATYQAQMVELASKFVPQSKTDDPQSKEAEIRSLALLIAKKMNNQRVNPEMRNLNYKLLHLLDPEHYAPPREVKRRVKKQDATDSAPEAGKGSVHTCTDLADEAIAPYLEAMRAHTPSAAA